MIGGGPAGTPQASGDGSRWRMPLGFLLLAVAVTALPVLVVEVPPLLDYPNHLARLWLLAGGAKQAPFDGIYGIMEQAHLT